MSYQTWDSDNFKTLIKTVMSECCSSIERGDIRGASELCLDLASFLQEESINIDAEGQWLALKSREVFYSLPDYFHNDNDFFERKKRLFSALRALRVHMESTPSVRRIGESVLSDEQMEELKQSKNGII